MQLLTRQNCVLSLSLLLIGCPKPSQTPNDKTGRFSLEVQLPKEGVLDPELLANGGTLRSGDRFALRLTVIEPLYLYVEQHAASGAISALHPPAADPPQTTVPGTALLLPASGSFQLDERIGRESIWVVASRSPLTPAQAGTAVSDAAATKTTERDPPPTTSVRGRGKVLWGGLDARGIGVIRFRLVHQ